MPGVVKFKDFLILSQGEKETSPSFPKTSSFITILTYVGIFFVYNLILGRMSFLSILVLFSFFFSVTILIHFFHINFQNCSSEKFDSEWNCTSVMYFLGGFDVLIIKPMIQFND